MSDLIICSDFLASLYQTAILVSPQAFQKSVLNHLDRVIGFDRAWWGMMSREKDGFNLHSSYRFELPPAFEEHWQTIKDDDALAYDAHDKPRTTIHYNEKALRSTPGLAELNTDHDLRHALCTSVFLPDKKSFLFISLFRSGTRARSFTSDEIKLKQQLTPHLYSCWRTNLLAEIERTRMTNKINDTATAFIDRKGMIVYADSLFGEFLGQEWPHWKGRRVPKQLLDIIDAPCKISNQDIRFYVDQCEAGGLFRLEIRRPSPLDKLTNREREIARGFAAAQSYKEIAENTNLASTTVRHYLRVIYTKLDINNKVELSKIVDKYDKNLKITQDLNEPPFQEKAHDFDFLGNGA